MSWLGVWTRAVIGPAFRRAAAVWAGAAIVSAVLFGPTGIQPSTVTLMMRHSLGAAVVLGGTWLLLFVPIARVIVHAEAARFLRSLPHSSLRLQIVRVLALVGLQLPWIALWVVGEIVQRPVARGQAVNSSGGGDGSLHEWFRGPVAVLIAIAASTILAVVISAWRPRPLKRTNRQWTSPTSAFRAIYLVALTRRAGDALVRGAGLSLLAGLAAGLFVHNNALVGEQAAKLAGIITALALVPAYVGVLSPLLEAHRSSTWLAQSSGVSSSTRAVALASTTVVVYGVASLLAMVGFAAASDGASVATTFPAVSGTLLACALAAALGAAWVVLRAVDATMAATQMVSGSLVIAVGIAVALATMSTPIGPIAALLATTTMLVVRSERVVDTQLEVRA